MQRRGVIWISGLASAAIVVGVLFYACARPPQMGADAEVFRTVDALYTAVTARDEKLLGECEKRLHAFKDAGKLPNSASAYLDDVIARSRQGRWQPAAERLYGFMSAQRREGKQKTNHENAKERKHE